jgi:hypothetical protein
MEDLFGTAALAFVRLAIFGPIIYVGLFLIVDATASCIPLNKIANTVWKLEAQLFYYQDAHRDRTFITNSVKMRLGIRSAGMLLVLFGLGNLFGMA